jgi:hypothetical protein
MCLVVIRGQRLVDAVGLAELAANAAVLCRVRGWELVQCSCSWVSF